LKENYELKQEAALKINLLHMKKLLTRPKKSLNLNLTAASGLVPQMGR
jgi:hypothetical protein